MITAVIFDCFGVFYVDPTKYFLNLAKQQHLPERAKRMAELVQQADYGFITEKEFFEQVAELFDITVKEVERRLTKGMLRNNELVEYAEKLREKYKIGLLSNISHGTMDLFFTPEERAELFDDIILSGDVGMIKPHPEIFELAVQRLGIKPYEAVFIDDNEINCASAEDVGMESIHYKTNQQTIGELEALLKQ